MSKQLEVKQVANKFTIDQATRVSKFGGGLINDTYLVETSKCKYILQKLHSIFKPTVLVDTYNITQYLLNKGLATPLLVKTRDSKLFLKDGENKYWRMLTYIPGRCYEVGITTRQAFSAGQLVGKFHDILSGYKYKFRHKINNFHNSDARIKKLKLTLKKFKNTEKYETLLGPATIILEDYQNLTNKTNLLPDRIIHGDLKINNIRFNSKGEALCLLDLDTLSRHKVVVDFAGGARTWCNKADEGDAQNSKFDPGVFKSMLAGYLSTAKFITKREIQSIPETIERVILVLAARFITDAFEEKYFRLNPGQYKNLYEQNKAKALAQIALYKDFVSKKKHINKIIKNLCK
ncbi:MAG: phosphotransferase [bacterium]|nr:phosphotransferase [bacterium]